MSVDVDVDGALADLLEISSQVQAAVVLDGEGDPLGSTLVDAGAAAELARAVRELLAAAERVRPEAGAALTQLEAATRAGSVFVVREGGRTIGATTAASPTVGLVLYDLKTCLRSLAGSGSEQAPVPEASPAAGGDGDAAA